MDQVNMRKASEAMKRAGCLIATACGYGVAGEQT